MATGVKDTDVWAAADALLHAGEQPTIERVRLHLGRGSPNTVGPHLKTWFRGLSQRLVAGQGGASDIPQAVTRAVSQVWEAALTAARDECATAAAQERAELAQAQSMLDAERSAIAQAQDRLRAREADLESSTQAAQAQALAAETRLLAAEQQARENYQSLKAAESELAIARTQLATLQQTLQDAQSAHREALAVAEARHVAHERRWLNDIDEQRQHLKKTQAALEQQQKAAAHRQDEQIKALAAAQKMLQDTNEKLTQAEQTHAHLAGQWLVEREQAKATQDGLQQRHAGLQRHLKALHAQIRIKDEQIAALTQRITALPPERLQASAPGDDT